MLWRQFVDFAKAEGAFTLNAVRSGAATRGNALVRADTLHSTTLRNTPQQHQDSAGVLPAIVDVVESYEKLRRIAECCL